MSVNYTLQEIEQLADPVTKAREMDRYYKALLAARDREMIQMSRSLSQMNVSTSVRSAVEYIPEYDGTNMSLKDFLQDVDNGFTLIEQDQEPLFLRHVIAKLRAKARRALDGLQINTVADLKKNLKEFLAPPKKYSYYQEQLLTMTMKRSENVREFYSRIRSLINSAVTAAKEIMAGDADANTNSVRTCLEDQAKTVFIRGLPDRWRSGVRAARPTNLSQALQIAIEFEEEDAEQSFSASAYMINETLNQQVYQRRTLDELPSTSRRVNFSEPFYDRESMPFYYDHKDVEFPRTYIDSNGRIVAPPQLSYSRSPNQPPGTVSILKRPNRDVKSYTPREEQGPSSSKGHWVWVPSEYDQNYSNSGGYSSQQTRTEMSNKWQRPPNINQGPPQHTSGFQNQEKRLFNPNRSRSPSPYGERNLNWQGPRRGDVETSMSNQQTQRPVSPSQPNHQHQEQHK